MILLFYGTKFILLLSKYVLQIDQVYWNKFGNMPIIPEVHTLNVLKMT